MITSYPPFKLPHEEAMMNPQPWRKWLLVLVATGMTLSSTLVSAAQWVVIAA